MAHPILVVVTGPSGAGKTTLSRRLAESLSLPCIGKDAIKEILFDETGVGDRAFSQGQGRACYGIMSLCAMEFLPSCGLILESNFSPQGLRDFLKPLREAHSPRVFIVSCTTESETLFRRVRNRVATGERHCGHADTDDFGFFVKHIAPPDSYATEDGDMLHIVDTNDFGSVDYEGIAGLIRGFIRQGGNG